MRSGICGLIAVTLAFACAWFAHLDDLPVAVAFAFGSGAFTLPALQPLGERYVQWCMRGIVREDAR